MTALADVLEAIHASHRRFRTVRAAGVSNGRAWRMCWAGPKRVRNKEERQEGALVIVQAGDQWWIRKPDGKGHTNEGDPNHRLLASARGPRLLRPRSLLGSTVLDYLREAAQPSAISGP